MSTRIGTSKNLPAGGTYDVLMIKVTSTYPEGQVTFAFEDTPRKITGLQKVSQYFLRLLLTSKGSDPFYPSRGTYMPTLMVGANLLLNNDTFLTDVKDAVADAANQARDKLNIDTSDLESTLDYVEVIGIDSVDEGWFVAINLYTLAGIGAEIALPFPELPTA